MTVDNLQNIQPTSDYQQQPVYVQQELAKDVLKQTMDSSSTQKQMLVLLNSTTPQQTNVQETAQKQISKGYLDVKV